MKTMITGGVVAAALGLAVASVTPMPASAQMARSLAAAANGQTNLGTQVQWRGRHGGWRGNHGWRGNRGWYGNRGGYRYGRWIGPGIGFGAGLALGSAFAAPSYYGPPAVMYADPSPSADEVAYCSRRFKSYDPDSGTYLGYDGNRHPCP